MLRRTAVLAVTSLALSGCVTYEVVERRIYHEDGSYTRIYDPYEDGRRYEERRPDRYRGYDDPYDRWFYGYRGHGSAWALDPYFGYGGSSVRIVYGNGWYRPAGPLSWWSSPAWSSPWGWSPWDYGYGYGYAPSRPYHPRPATPRPTEPRPMPKPTVRGIGPQVSLPVMSGPSVGGEALRPSAREARWATPESNAAVPDARPVAKPQPVFVDAPPQEPPRFEPREPERVFERRVEPPRFEPREPERVFERPVEQPRFEPREEPRFEARPEPREAPEVEERAD